MLWRRVDQKLINSDCQLGFRGDGQGWPIFDQSQHVWLDWLGHLRQLSSIENLGRHKEIEYCIYILSWVYVCHTIKRNASQGVLKMSQCSSNPCELMRDTKTHTYTALDLVAPVFTEFSTLVLGKLGIYTPWSLLLQATTSEVVGVLPCYSLLSQSHSSSPQPLLVRLLDLW
jgi:hypothetical protein